MIPVLEPTFPANPGGARPAYHLSQTATAAAAVTAVTAVTVAAAVAAQRRRRIPVVPTCGPPVAGAGRRRKTRLPVTCDPAPPRCLLSPTEVGCSTHNIQLRRTFDRRNWCSLSRRGRCSVGLGRVAPCRAVPCRAVLCRAMPSHVMSCRYLVPTSTLVSLFNRSLFIELRNGSVDGVSVLSPV